jgi:pimeloyl-ACP methyl ester carboxylesterase
MRSLVLVHGAGSGPWIWESWLDVIPGATVEAVDLQAGLIVAEAGMANYEAEVDRACEGLPRPLALVGWSLGGLAAMLAARRVEPDRLVLLEASPPAEVQGRDDAVAIEPGTFDPERAYGPFPRGIRARPESSLARAERRRGVSVPELPFTTLVVDGEAFTELRGRHVSERYGAARLHLPGLDHWGLVLDGRARAAVAAWLLGEDVPLR